MIKVDIMAVFSKFHDRGKFEKNLNATFISLIPKIHGASEIKDFVRLALWEGHLRLLPRS